MNEGRSGSAPITLETRIEDLAERNPEAVRFLLGRGMRCIRCGEPIWSTLGELLDDSGFADKESVLRELNALGSG